MSDAIENRARELYEASRKTVGGRPKWENLDPADRYDMGMKDAAMGLARTLIASEPR